MIKYMQYISSIYFFHLGTVVTLDLQACIMEYLDFLYPVLISILATGSSGGSSQDMGTPSSRRRGW
jgi:hypothetical protein